MTMTDNPRDDFLTLASHAHTCPGCSGLWGHDATDCGEELYYECDDCINAFRADSACRVTAAQTRSEGER